MPLKKKPVTGMKDILPAEMQIRDYVTGLIKETYKSFGFSPIETPCDKSRMKHILLASHGRLALGMKDTDTKASVRRWA